MGGGSDEEASREVLKIEHDTIYPREDDSWDDVSVTIPPLPPTLLGEYVGIIHLKYTLQVGLFFLYLLYNYFLSSTSSLKFFYI